MSGLSVIFQLPGCRIINMCVETAATAQVTLEDLLDSGYMGFFNSAVMFKSRDNSFQRRPKGERQIS